MEEKELIKKVELYLKKVKRKYAKEYKLNEKGLYKILGGSFGRKGNREEIAIVEGRFIDAIIYAIKQTRFYGESSNNYKDLSYFDSGKIEKLKIKKLPKEEGLIKKLKKS